MRRHIARNAHTGDDKHGLTCTLWLVTHRCAAITEGDIPWPDVGSSTRYGLGIHDSMTAAAKRSRLRVAIRRWHPDKFMQKFGSNLLPSARDAVRARLALVRVSVGHVYMAPGQSDECSGAPCPVMRRGRSQIMERVKSVSQALNAMGERIKKEMDA